MYLRARARYGLDSKARRRTPRPPCRAARNSATFARFAVPLHAHMQRLDAGDGQERVHRRHRRPVIAQRHRPRLGGEGEVAEILVEPQPVIGRLRLGQRREFAARAQSNLPDSTTMPPMELPCPPRNLVVEWSHGSAPHSNGRHRNGVASVLSTISGMPTEWAISAIAARSTTTPPGFARLSTKIALHFGVSARRKFSGSSGSTKWQVPAELFEAQAELRQRPAIQSARCQELVPRFQHRREHQELRGVARGGGDGGAAALQAGDAFLQHRNGRVGQARVDVAEIVQVEQRRGMIDVVEHISRGLVRSA
jgi:hypothetical protein